MTTLIERLRKLNAERIPGKYSAVPGLTDGELLAMLMNHAGDLIAVCEAAKFILSNICEDDRDFDGVAELEIALDKLQAGD